MFELTKSNRAISFNKNGATLKTNKSNLDIWMNNIKEHCTSLDYTTLSKDLTNGKQHIFELENTKTIFEYFNTGRITVKHSDKEKFTLHFFDQHENILGVKLQLFEKDEKPLYSSTPNKHTSFNTRQWKTYG